MVFVGVKSVIGLLSRVEMSEMVLDNSREDEINSLVNKRTISESSPNHLKRCDSCLFMN